MTSPVKPPSLHDLLSAAGDINTMKPKALRLLCNALIAYAFAAEDAKNEAQAREQQTYLALVKRGPPVPTRTISQVEVAKMYPAKRVRGKETTALLRKCRKPKPKLAFSERGRGYNASASRYSRGA